MWWIVYFFITFLITIFFIPLKQALLYGFVTVIIMVFVRMIFTIIIATIVPHRIRIKNIKKLEKISLFIFYAFYIIGSFIYMPILALPAIINSVIDYNFKKTSDKIVFNE